MENYYVKNKKDIIKHSKNSLGLMTDLVESKYPVDQRDTYLKLVVIINKVFDTEFTEDDLIAYNALNIEIEDKLLIHKHITGYDHGDISQYGDINGE
tara:strand:+ start:3983 stop:4273 length:291 start_codon:yes stop_codon:yes gene_type:complete